MSQPAKAKTIKEEAAQAFAALGISGEPTAELISRFEQGGHLTAQTIATFLRQNPQHLPLQLSSQTVQGGQQYFVQGMDKPVQIFADAGADKNPNWDNIAKAFAVAARTAVGRKSNAAGLGLQIHADGQVEFYIMTEQPSHFSSSGTKRVVGRAAENKVKALRGAVEKSPALQGFHVA